MSELFVGNVAPDFKVSVKDHKYLALSELLGNYVVLYFYPRDNTPGCTVEVKDFNKLLPKFTKLGAQVISISKDSLSSHEKFKNKFDLRFHLNSDTDTKLCKNYGVWVEKSMYGKKYMGIICVTFLIDRKGKIAHI